MRVCLYPNSSLFTIHLPTSFDTVKEEQIKTLHNKSVINDDLSKADDVSASYVR
jgi:hypothetical protein